MSSLNPDDEQALLLKGEILATAYTQANRLDDARITLDRMATKDSEFRLPSCKDRRSGP